MRGAIKPSGDRFATEARAVRVMDQLKGRSGLPEAVHSDKGPELLSGVFNS